MARGNFGERLKRERELREVTLQEITSATRIGPRFLEALENEEWEKLPGGVFNRGFVRSIARYLGLDEEALLGEYDLALSAQVPSPEATAQPEKSTNPRGKPALIVLLILALIAGAVYGSIFAWRYYVSHRSVKQVPAAGPPAPTLPPPATPPTVQKAPQAKPNPAQSVSGQLELLVSASADTHLLVLVDGSVAYYDEVHASQNLRFTADTGFEVTAADSGAVLLEMNGQAMPPLGTPGSSGTIKLSREDLRQATGGDTQH